MAASSWLSATESSADGFGQRLGQEVQRFGEQAEVDHQRRQHADHVAVGATTVRDLPIVGDVRGAGYFYGIELVKDKATRESFDEAESERLLRGFLSKALFEAGLYCRADDRGDPVIQLAPPLTIGEPEFAEIGGMLRDVLTRASDLV